VRDNERAAAAFSIEPVRAKLAAFALSGGLAGLAGGLYAVALRGMPFSGFSPDASLVVFTMVVIGGVASIPGALMGAAYVRGAQYFLHGAAQLLATGAGLLLLLMVIPGGLGEVVFSLTDRFLRYVARRHNLSVPSLAELADELEPAKPVGAEAAAALAILDDEVDRPANGLSASEPIERVLAACEGIDAGYGGIQVLFAVDAQVGDGEMVALLGTNGAGKSTVLRVIAGLLRPAQGRVVFEGEDITALDAVDRVKAGLVTVPGGRGVFPSLTVEENLRLAGWLYKRDTAFIEQVDARVFELFPVLRDRLGSKAGLLSGGEQQMLTIAQALYCRPRLLMIDELSLGLAPAMVATLLDAVREINARGTAVVVVEQSVNVATTLANRAIFMEKGQVRFTGPTAQLHERTDLLRSVFLRSGAPAQARAPRRQATGTALPLLEVRGVERRFGGVRAVNGVDLAVAPGQIHGVIGSNGAGKTTLFDICSGFVQPDAGAIVLAGRDLTAMTAAERGSSGLGRTFQDARLFPSLTVAENLAVALERHVEVREPLACTFHVGAVAVSERAVSARVDELIDTMGLGRYRRAFASELSTGTRRIVELACAMAHDPAVLLLDEPSSGIAQRESEALAELLVDLRDRTGAALVVIEHDIPLVSSIADRLTCLHLGRVIAEGRPAEVLANPEVIASYLGTDPAAVARSGPVNGARPGRLAGLTTNAYASQTGLSVDAVRRMVRTGTLTASKVGGRYIITPATEAGRPLPPSRPRGGRARPLRA
jgi:ABC-type branched-subunit amino acid transport system ATPase component